MARKIFTFVIVAFPVLSIYGIGISSLTIGDIALMFSLCTLLPLRENLYINKTISNPWLIYFLYIAFISFLIQFYDGETIFRILRYLFYIFVLAFFTKNNFDINFGKKLYLYISYIAVAIMFVQIIIFAMRGTYISGYIPGLTVMRESAATYYEYAGEYGMMRPRSIFAEPAHYCQYLLGALILLLFSNQRDIKSWIGIVVLSIGILMSVSSTGIISMVIIYVFFLWKNARHLLVYLPIAITLLWIVARTASFQYFIERMQEGRSTAGRMNSYEYILSELPKTTTIELLVGHGFINYDIYLVGFPGLFYYFGICGLITFIWIMLSHYKRCDIVQNMLIFTFLLINIGTEALFGPFILLYIPFLITKRYCC